MCAPASSHDHLDQVELAEVDEGLHGDALIELHFLQAHALDDADGDAAREDGASGAGGTGGDHVLPHLDLLVLVDVLQRNVTRDAAAQDALSAAGHDHPVHVALLVDDKGDPGRVGGHARDAAHQPGAVHDGVVHVHAARAAHVDRCRRVPGGGRPSDDTTGDEPHAFGEDLVVPQLDHGPQLVVLGL